MISVVVLSFLQQASTASVAFAFLMCVAASSGTRGAAVIVAVAVVSPTLSTLGPVLGIATSTIWLILSLGVATAVVLRKLAAGTRASFPTVFVSTTLIFLIYAWLRITPMSFRYGPNMPSSRGQGIADLDSLALAAVVLLGTTLLIAQLHLSSQELVRAIAWVSAGTGLLAVSLGVGGIWVARDFALLVVASLVARRLRWRWALGITGVVGLGIQGHQGPVIAAVVGLCVASLAGKRSYRTVAGACLVLFGGAAIVSFLGPALQSWIDGDGNFTARMQFATQTWNDSSREFLWGQGFGTSPSSLLTYPHNSALEVLFGLGVIGLALWLVLVAVMARASTKAGLLALWVTALLFSFTSGNFIANPEYWVLGAAAVAIAHGSPMKDNLSTASTRRLRKVPIRSVAPSNSKAQSRLAEAVTD